MPDKNRFISSYISIHTPARGVTMCIFVQRQRKKISIHTPARGVTSSLYDYFLFHQHFNPHSRKGSDHDSTKRCTPFLISIHTPARGVTGQVISYGRFAIDFNPHSRKGSDSIVHSSPYQETNFNPHSRKGSDATKQ